MDETALAALKRGGDSYRWQSLQGWFASGKAQIVLFENGTYAALAKDNDDLVVLALTGNDARKVTSELLKIARENGLNFVRFVTTHKALSRLLNKFEPINCGTIYRIPSHESKH